MSETRRDRRGTDREDPEVRTPPPIYVVAGGYGDASTHLVNTVLAQFPDRDVPVILVDHVSEVEELERVVDLAAANGGTIVHTLVNAYLRGRLRAMTEFRGVAAMDLLGDLIERLASILGRLPLGQPGRYHELHGSYFDRIEAIEYSIAHDDGARPEGWAEADVLLVGVSRTGKTPLSIYLSVLGWKVANLPLAPGVAPPAALYELDRGKVIGLTIDMDRLLGFRQQRGRKMGIGRGSPYADPGSIQAELDMARQVFRRGGFFVLNVTDRTVETNAQAIIQRLGGRASAESETGLGSI